jgi:hypothetical protein
MTSWDENAIGKGNAGYKIKRIEQNLDILMTAMHGRKSCTIEHQAVRVSELFYYTPLNNL